MQERRFFYRKRCNALNILTNQKKASNLFVSKNIFEAGWLF